VRATCWLLAQPIFRLRKAGMPEHAFFSSGTNAGLAMMAVSLIITCIGIGFLAANSLVWIIPPLRRFFERDAQKTGTPGFARSGSSCCSSRASRWPSSIRSRYWAA
jgi:hypothetical protein